jgi:hypothetical protein
MRPIILALYIFWKCVIDYTFLSVSIHAVNIIKIILSSMMHLQKAAAAFNPLRVV